MSIQDDKLRLDGTVDKRDRNCFRVTLDNGHKLLATMAGKLRLNRIYIVAGDRVNVELSMYDLSRGRIVYRY